ncbi:uncharacterized protein LOC143219111 isoform X2 [Lasioglossum baleicum]|uniref:uncharacterized protein LOC143219111 isoform X2 n=1 Tax=Lasioglossum baleicum TaxID=434251 RepID=UPI003FCE9658
MRNQGAVRMRMNLMRNQGAAGKVKLRERTQCEIGESLGTTRRRTRCETVELLGGCRTARTNLLRNWGAAGRLDKSTDEPDAKSGSCYDADEPDAKSGSCWEGETS